MSRFIIALVLLFVTGLLTVTDVVSFSLPVLVCFSPAFILSVLIVIGHLYVCSVDFVRRIVALYDCYELVNFHTPGSKSYSDCYVLALFQIGVEQLRQTLKQVVLGWCRILSQESIYWTLRTMFSLEFNDHYDKDRDFAIDPAPEPEQEAVYANASYSADLDERRPYTQLADRSTDLPPPEVPSPVPSQDYTGVAAGFRPRSSLNLARIVYEESLRMQQANNPCQGLIDNRFVPRSTCFLSSSSVGRTDHRSESTLPGIASTPIDEISMSLGSVSLRENQNPSSTTARQQITHADNTSNSPSRFIPLPAAFSTTSSLSHGSLHELVPDTDTSDSSSDSHTSSDERCEANGVIGRSSRKVSQTSSRRVRGFPTRAMPKTSPLYAPKEIMEAQVVSGEDKVAAVLHRSQWKQKQNWRTRSKKQGKKAQAPTGIRSPVAELMETNTVGTETARCGVEEEPVEPRGVSNTMGTAPILSSMASSLPPQASSLVRVTMDISTARAKESTGALRIKDLPRRKITGSVRTAAPPTSDATALAPMGFIIERSHGPAWPMNNLETSEWIPTAATLPTPGVMKPKDLAAAMNEKAKRTGGTCRVRLAPVYKLLDKGRTVVNKGERIPPYTQYQVRDEKGTSLRMTGSKGMRV
ncbi:hypothetical protein FRC06_003906 [Ceratobasidium sp. 370]|nr:hypothetical protein FRC06_003906 [Ceratobasidium sp. 370]